jgi:predicted RNase H-like HicB family nuclease
MDKSKFQMLIQWSEEDNCYVVFLPDFVEVNQPCTDGATYLEAAQHGQELIESLCFWYQQEGKKLPQPRTLQVA